MLTLTKSPTEALREVKERLDRAERRDRELSQRIARIKVCLRLGKH